MNYEETELITDDIILLSLYDKDLHDQDDNLPNYVRDILRGDWLKPIKDNEESILSILKNPESSKLSSDNYTSLLCSGICCLNAFCEINWTGLTNQCEIFDINETIKKFEVNISNITYGEDVYYEIHNVELLSMASSIFDFLSKHCNKVVLLWWKLRTYFTIQKVLDNNSYTLYTEIETLIGLLSNKENILAPHPELYIKLNLEICQIFLLYRRVNKSHTYLEKAKNIACITLELKGALGRRTKFQQKATAQLIVESKIEDTAWRTSGEVTHKNTVLPESVKLDDDLRLETVKFEDPDEISTTTFTALEQLICLLSAQYTQISQPKDNLSDDEVIPFLTVLLDQQFGPWAVRIHTFLIKCKLESNHKRTVERSMMQCEEIVNSFKTNQPTEPMRLSYLWASGLPPYIKWRAVLADLLLSIGLIKAALDIYLDLQLWEEVIVCYTILELPHKAAEIIKQQIEEQPTAKLYCLLGDATDDPALYETAWEFSKHRSSRAQKHWGNYLYSHKRYEECIPHYEKSLEINSIQEIVWLRLGYAALSTENWEVAANAYRRYTYLESNSFEAWNNLAKVYVKQGNKERAHKALSEALKYNYDSWQVWENMVLVSIDTGHFEDVLRGYHRLLDLKKKHIDIEVLSLLVKAVMNDTLGADKNGSKRLIPRVLELFSRVTLVHQNNALLWELYSDISPTAHLRAQRLLNCYRSITQAKHNWVTDVELCEKIMDLVENMSKTSLLSFEECKASPDSLAQLSSARLTLQGVVRTVRGQNYEQFEEKLSSLQELLDNITSQLKIHM